MIDHATRLRAAYARLRRVNDAIDQRREVEAAQMIDDWPYGRPRPTAPRGLDLAALCDLRAVIMGVIDGLEWAGWERRN